MASSSVPSSAPLRSPLLVPKHQAPPSPPEAPALIPKHQAPPSPPEPPSPLLPRNHQAPAASPTPDQPTPKKLHGPEILAIAFLAFAFCIAVGVIISTLYQRRRRRRQQDAQQRPTEQQDQRPEFELPLAPSTSQQATTTDDGLGYQQHEIQPGFIPGMRPDAIDTLRQISYVPTPILPGREFDHICCMCREPYFATDRLVILEPCHHTAHIKCACRALPTRGACPICEGAVLPYRPLAS